MIETDERPPESVRAMLRTYIDESAEPDPRVLADKIASDLPVDTLRDVVRWALPGALRLLMSHETTQKARDAAKGGHDEASSTPGPSRFAGVGDVYRKWVTASVFNGTEWKFAGDCTVEDCDALRDQRFDQAKATAVEGRRWEIFGKALREKKARTISELDELTVIEVLRWQP